MAAAGGDTEMRRAGKSVFVRFALNGFLVVLLGSINLTVVTGSFLRATGEPRQFGLGESPLVYAHRAALFAGRPGMPDRALAYDLIHGGVYTYHNWPRRKVFIDGRLEVPDRETFQTYVRVENMLIEGRPGWAELLRRLGEPLVLLGHATEFRAEATLLVQPGWRCVYFDAIASVFVSSSRSDLEEKFPTVDFAARYFHDQEWRAAPPEPFGIGEGKALLNLASALKYRDGSSGDLATSVVLSAGHRFRQALATDPTIASSWALLGASCWNMIADLTVAPQGPAEPWDIARGILAAQASYGFRRSLELDPGDQAVASSFLGSLEARGMRDPARALFELRELTSANTNASREELARRVAELLEAGRFEAVLPCFNDAESRGVTPDWATSDRVAATLLHLGRPADARRVWERAADPPSQAVRLSRIATAALAAQDFAAARAGFESALKLDSGLGETWFGLALLHVQLGDAQDAAAACEAGLRGRGTEAQSASLKVFQELVQPRRAGASKIRKTE